MIIYFGLGELPKVLLIFIGTLFFNTLMIMDAVKFVPRELLETALTLGGKKRDLLLRVIALLLHRRCWMPSASIWRPPGIW